ncbi:hypothetical protein OJJOAM_000184 [Cupriavidus sp. H18C1]
MDHPLFPQFRSIDVETDSEVRIHAVVGGDGPPLLLLHGHPQTHAIWHKVAPTLAQRFTVVACDLRGYGDSSKPAGTGDHGNYSKRTMARDALRVMRSLGFDRFRVLAHDRGARVAHRLGMDHPDAVERMVLLDIAPTLAMYEQTTEAFARAYWHWFFLIQPAPLPERLIEADPSRYIRDLMGGRSAGLSPFDPPRAARIRALRGPARRRAWRLRGLSRRGRHRSRARPRRPRGRQADDDAAAGAVGRTGRGPSLLPAAAGMATSGGGCRRRTVAVRALHCRGSARCPAGTCVALPGEIGSAARPTIRGDEPR